MKFFYLDLHPPIMQASGRSYTRKAVNRWGTPRCFMEEDLYTARYGFFESDAIERKLFGPIDARGERAIDFFTDYEIRDGVHDAIHDLAAYMDAQVLRTPKGLDRIALLTRSRRQNGRLIMMQSLRQMHLTMWFECVWEVLTCDASRLPLLLTDTPVAFYNRASFPGALESKSPNEPPLGWVGTQTLFPLRRDRLLVLTHTAWARDPSYDARKDRPNARAFEQTMFNLQSIITGRSLSEIDVAKVNFILKTRARRFIAACREDDLYPERKLPSTHWSKIGAGEFLMPDPRDLSFTTGIAVGFKDRRSFFMDEYGRRHDAANVERQREREWRALQRRKAEYDARLGPKENPHWLRRMGHREKATESGEDVSDWLESKTGARPPE